MAKSSQKPLGALIATYENHFIFWTRQESPQTCLHQDYGRQARG